MADTDGHPAGSGTGKQCSGPAGLVPVEEAGDRRGVMTPVVFIGDDALHAVAPSHASGDCRDGAALGDLHERCVSGPVLHVAGMTGHAQMVVHLRRRCRLFECARPESLSLIRRTFSHSALHAGQTFCHSRRHKGAEDSGASPASVDAQPSTMSGCGEHACEATGYT